MHLIGHEGSQRSSTDKHASFAGQAHRVHGLLLRGKAPTAWRAFIFPAFSWMVIALDTTFFSASMASASAWMAVLSVCAWPSEAPMWFCRSKASNLVCCATACRSSSCGEPPDSVRYSLPP